MSEATKTRETYSASPSSAVLLPSLELRHADGRPAPLWAYRGRGPLIVLLHEGRDCAACLAQAVALAAALPIWREMGAQVLAIGPDALDGLPFAALVDDAGRLAAALQAAGVLAAPALPALLVVGRTSAVWAAWSGAHERLPSHGELLGWLEYSLSECRECFCCELVWPAS